MCDLDRAILERHSTRKFLPRPVPRAIVDEALALAQHAPSNSSIQPWRLTLVSGAARDRLRDALFRVADHEAPHIPTLIPPERTIVCALAVGYPDPDFPANKLRIGRDPVAKHVVLLDT